MLAAIKPSEVRAIISSITNAASLRGKRTRDMLALFFRFPSQLFIKDFTTKYSSNYYWTHLQGSVSRARNVRLKPTAKAPRAMCLFRKASQSHHIQSAENTTGPAIASAIAIRLKRSATVKVPENTPHKRQRTMGIIVIFDAAFSRGFTPSCPEV